MPLVRFKKCLQAGSVGNAGTSGTDRAGAAMMFALQTASFGTLRCNVLKVCGLHCPAACI